MAQPQVPDDVRKYGITTQKQSPDFVVIISLYSPDGTLDDLFLSNYASINIVDILNRLPGVGDVEIFGEKKYAMRLWLNPDKLTSMEMTAMDVIAAVQEQNVQVAAGTDRQSPEPSGTDLYLFHQHAGQTLHSRRVRKHHHSHEAGRFRRADQRRGTR